jgi:hypothetical protein
MLAYFILLPLLGISPTSRLIVAAACLPVFFIIIWHLERLVVLERRGSHCQKCGYDLTGNVSGRCPECGEETGTAKT